MPVTFGTYVSGAGHTALIVWLLAGWGLDNEPLDFQISEVTVVSGDAFESLLRATSPDPTTTVPDTPVAPSVEETPQLEAPEPDAPTTPPAPEVTQPPEQEAPPPDKPEPLAPPAEVVDQAPQPALPEITTGALDLPPSDTPQPNQADRVASAPVAPPPPDVEVAPIEQQAVEEEAEAPVEEQVTAQEATAPEETTTEIVTEAEIPAAAPERSPRPASRPTRPEPAPTQPTDAEAEALAALLAGGGATSEPAPATASGPPLSGSEQEAFRLAVSSCWNVDPGAEWARVAVTVAFDLTPEGKVAGDVTFVSARGGTDALAQTAFQTARRAVMICGARGFNLPSDKYEHWKTVELTFDPAGMRLR